MKIFLNLQYSFFEYFLINPNLIIYQNYSRQINFLTNSYITNCFFYSLNFLSGSGGAIFYKNILINLLIDNSHFENCSANNFGGAISFQCSTGGNLILDKVCSNSCYLQETYWTDGGQFLYGSVFKNGTLNLTSYSKSCPISKFNNKQESILLLIGGIQKITQINSSYNLVYRFSGIALNSNLNYIKFSNFYKNNATWSGCIHYFTSIGYQYLNFSNIIENNSESSDTSNVNGVILGQTNSIIEINNCIFQNNRNKLLAADSGTIKVINSFINHPIQNISNGRNGILITLNCNISVDLLYNQIGTM